MENAFKAYFKRTITKKFNTLNTASNFENMLSFVKQFPNDFIRDYFIYFLGTEYAALISNYTSADLDKLLKNNPYIGRVKKEVLSRESIYQ